MLIDIDKTREESRWLARMAKLVLLVGLILSLAAWLQAAKREQAQADEAFTADATSLQQRLAQQLDHYIDALGAFQALFQANDAVGRRTFHQRFVDMAPEREYPALTAIQFARQVTLEERSEFERRVSGDRSITRQGYPGFQIKPAGDRPLYVPIVFNEPMANNQAAFGFDILTRPLLKEAMERARDNGRSSLSQPVVLIQGGVGFIVRLPVYKLNRPVKSLEERHKAFIGTVSGVFRAPDLMRQVLPSDRWAQLHWTVRDRGPGLDPSPPPLFDSAEWVAPQFDTAEPLNRHNSISLTLPAGDRTWTLTLTQGHRQPLLAAFPMALLLASLTTTLGLWWALRGAALRHGKAAAMARELSNQALGNEQRLRAVLDNTIDGILALTEDGHIIGANLAICRMFDRAHASVIGATLDELIPHASVDSEASLEAFLQLQHAGMNALGRRTEGLRGGGQTFPLDLTVSSMLWEGQKQYILVVRDLSPQEAADRAIFEAQRQLNEVDEMRRVIVHSAPYAIFVLNPSGVIQTVNPAGERLIGYRANELVGRCTTQRFFDPEQVKESAHLIAMRQGEPESNAELDVLTHLAKESPGVPSEWRMIRSDGSTLVAEILVTELSDEYGTLTGYLVMAHDVTLRREAEVKLEHMALHDSLTALPNRNMLQEQLKTSLAMAEREQFTMGLMFLDLDRFKKINDTLGHHIGDTVLVEVARRLRNGMRTSDIVARLGGDEFVILLPRLTDESDGAVVARKVLDLFDEPIRVGPHELRITPSIGMVLYPQHGGDAITLMRHADLAMYQAKNNGRHQIQMFSPQMASATVDTLLLENDLYRALEREELLLHFQPQFDCATGHITGVEALLRWEHKGRLIPPSDFIPLAEETGLIVQMGKWVLRRACTMGQQWRAQTGWPLRVAVNLSAVQLESEDIVATVDQALRDTGLPPTALELEITESVLVRESLRAADVLTQLRLLGVSIAIDDFGVGYSSFAYLRELPVDRFKLDRSFLAQVPHSPGDSRLVGALIAMGHRLEVAIVAEGVENEDQAAFLRDHGCDEAQGFHLSRPLTEAAFEALLCKQSATPPA
ncbi:MAG: bifunctional diguanylate cyclase/phosphodiesterase [Aquabacterium sp.]|uniref:bifunctional diguanylate cyclase/phosphodiesterase n=1 Tax=Aquabacterium sp. TaxID=1872578 RepID=UPI003BCA230D